VAIDYPFTGYHELTNCYGSTGWHVISEKTADEPTGRFQWVEMEKYPQQHGLLLFSLSDERERSVNPEPGFDHWSIRNSLAAYRDFALGGPTYQVQVIVQRYSPLSKQQLDDAEQLFMQSRAMLLTQLRSQTKQP
jgi:hypothetical protein